MNIRFLAALSLLLNAVLSVTLIFFAFKPASDAAGHGNPPPPAEPAPTVPQGPVAPQPMPVHIDAPPSSRETTEAALPKAVSREQFVQEFLKELDGLGMRIVPARLLLHTTIEMFNTDARLSPQVRDLFALGDEETERINARLRETADRLRELETAGLAVTYTAPATAEDGQHQVRIKVPPVGDQAQVLQEELRGALVAELGDVDGPLFWDMMQSGHNQTFWHSFGEGGVEYVIDLTPTEKGLHYQLKRTLGAPPTAGGANIRPPRSESMRSTASSPEAVRNALERYLERQQYIFDYLPEDVRQVLELETP